MVDPRAAENWARQLLAMYPQAFPRGLADATAFVNANGVGALPGSTAAPPAGQQTAALPADQGRTKVQPKYTDASTAPAGTPPSAIIPPNQVPTPNGVTPPPASGATPPPARTQAGVEGDPGPEKYGTFNPVAGAKNADGSAMGPIKYRVNSNQAGVQSNGDDDPWLIGAFEGGTYDPEVMKRWMQRAQAGDASAAWVLKQVGMDPEMAAKGEAAWAASRNLTRRSEAFAPGGKYYTDPANSARGTANTGAAASGRAAQPQQAAGAGPRPAQDPAQEVDAASAQQARQAPIASSQDPAPAWDGDQGSRDGRTVDPPPIATQDAGTGQRTVAARAGADPAADPAGADGDARKQQQIDETADQFAKFRWGV